MTARYTSAYTASSPKTFSRRFDQALEMLEEIDFPQELIATRSRESFLDAMRAARIEPARRNPLVL